MLLGSTGVGKTDLSIEVAKRLGTCVIGCDSRQIYREMSIGTAVPSKEQLSEVPHYMIQNHSITERYDASQYEREALEIIQREFAKGHEDVVLCGGSMMYIDVLCYGIDDIPPIPQSVRRELNEIYRRSGLEPIREELKQLDPTLYATMDLNNRQRVIHAVEVCRVAGVPYSSLRTNRAKRRNFDIVKVGLKMDREVLYERIDARVEEMLRCGLEDEVRGLLPMRECNALNTVGYREFFDYFDGKLSYEETVSLIKRNTRHYARRQMTWFNRDLSIKWFNPADRGEIFEFLGI